jgi:hypothetical protein
MTTLAETATVHSTQRNRKIPFSELADPGTYISNATGNLFRVPEDALVVGRSPLIEIVSKGGTMMTQISDDPWLPISKARQIAADSDLSINF